MRDKKTAKEEIWKTLSELYDDNFDQSVIIDTLAEILQEEVRDHVEAYDCNCSLYVVTKKVVPKGEVYNY